MKFNFNGVRIQVFWLLQNTTLKTWVWVVHCVEGAVMFQVLPPWGFLVERHLGPSLLDKQL